MDQSNSAMIQKLMARKKSYERMMNIEDTMSNNRGPVAYMSDLTNKKNQEILLSAARPVQLSRITKLDGVTSVKKQLQYYQNETPPGQRKQSTGVKSRLIQPITAATLDITGQRVGQSNKNLNSYKSNASLLNEHA